MGLLKDETTVRLDDAGRAAVDALGLYRDLGERIEDAEIKSLLSEQLDTQTRLLRRIEDLRRSQGELPQAGDPEHWHLEAAGAYLRAIVLPGETTSHYVESLLEAASRVTAELDQALALDLGAGLRELLAQLREVNTDFETRLRASSAAAK